MDFIIEAATTGNDEALRIALEEYPSSLTRSNDLAELLPFTMVRKYFACFKLLLESGASCISSKGSLFHMACKMKTSVLPYLELLTAHRAGYLDTLNSMGQTPLHASCLLSNYECAKHLVQSGASIQALCGPQNTPLHCACSTRSHAIVELLLNHGADMEAQNLNEQRPLHLACQLESSSCAQILLDGGAHIEDLDIDGKSPLMTAVEYQALACVKLLIQKGADVNSRDITGRTNLHWACMMEDGFHFVEALIEGGADVNAGDNKYRTPLYVVCQFNYLNSLELLLEKKADANIENLKGNNPMHRAVTSLITDVTAQREIVNHLIDAGCNPEIRNDLGKTPADVAIHTEIQDHLRRYMELNPWFRRSIIKNF